MNTKDFSTVANALFEKMKHDRYCQDIISTARYVLEYFHDYCEENNILDISLSDAERFTKTCFGFDFHARLVPIQFKLRRPLLILFEFEETGTFAKTHRREPATHIPSEFKEPFEAYRVYTDSLGIKKATKRRRVLVLEKYFCHIRKSGFFSLSSVPIQSVHAFTETLGGYALTTQRSLKNCLRLALDWLFANRFIPFSGNQAFPVIHEERHNKLVSYYSREETMRILSSIDTGNQRGKFVYCVMNLLANLGMRASDVVNLKFSDIDWECGTIRFMQQKTGNPAFFPLIDEVKLPLIDYIKNARPSSNDREHIFITPFAPYTTYTNGSVLYNVVKDCMNEAGIDFKGRHHGSHSLRHSLATSLMADNVPISGISEILGHTSSLTTEMYLSVDETHLKELTLEVPYGK